jgi:hypothetical protein
MTPLPAKYSRLLREEVAPSTQNAADAAEAVDVARWAMRHGRCIMPLHHGALCLAPRNPGALLCNGCRRVEG